MFLYGWPPTGVSFSVSFMIYPIDLESWYLFGLED